jgi:Glycosyl hydrolases family 18
MSKKVASGIFVFVAVCMVARPDFASPVTAWVPSYAVSACKTMLQKDFGGVSMGDALTFLPLQTYVPTSAGTGLSKDMADADVTWFVNWGHQHSIKVLACIWNSSSYSWSLATNAFRVHQSEFVKAIVAECNRINLDGVDLDFEGNDANGQPIDNTTDRNAFIAFCDSLVAYLHPLGKVVTVASFSAGSNAPNWNYWPALLPVIDGICTMGYNNSSSNSDYAAQKSHATADLAHFMIGMPGWMATWGGLDVNPQIDWITSNSPVGLGIWDAQLSGGGNWQTAQVWNKIKAIKNYVPTREAMPFAGVKHTDDFNVTVVSLASPRVTVTTSSRIARSAVVEIFDSRGSLIATLPNETPASGGFFARWNGSIGGGRTAAIGSYVAALCHSGTVLKALRFALAP